MIKIKNVQRDLFMHNSHIIPQYRIEFINFLNFLKMKINCSHSHIIYYIIMILMLNDMRSSFPSTFVLRVKLHYINLIKDTHTALFQGKMLAGIYTR